MGLPIVELHSDRGPSQRPGLLALLRVLHERCDLRAFDPNRPAVWARVASSTGSIPPASLTDTRAGLAVSLGRGEQPDRAMSSRATAFIVETVEEAERLGDRAIVVADDAIDGADHPPLGPLNRVRRRAALGLPDAMVVDVGLDDDFPVAAPAPATGLALAASAAVRGPAVVVGLALGTPMTTDEPTATAFGLRDGHEVIVAHPGELLRVAHELAANAPLAASIGRGATQRFAAAFDARGAAMRLLARLGTTIPDPLRRVRERLDELATPVVDERALRALAAVIELSPDHRRDIVGAWS